MRLTAVVPTYNEVDNLAPLVAQLLDLALPDIELTILVVDDASPDGTGRLADRLAAGARGRVAVLHRPGKGGLGSAYTEGFARAIADGADLIAQLDADLSHEPTVLRTMCQAARGADLVVGSRYRAGGGVDRTWSKHRRALSWLANRVVTPLILGLPLTDPTSGYRLWRREALARIAPLRVRSCGYGFQVEMAYLAHRLGCRLSEVPIYFRDRCRGESKMEWDVKIAAVREIFSIRWQHRAISVDAPIVVSSPTSVSDNKVGHRLIAAKNPVTVAGQGGF